MSSRIVTAGCPHDSLHSFREVSHFHFGGDEILGYWFSKASSSHHCHVKRSLIFWRRMVRGFLQDSRRPAGHPAAAWSSRTTKRLKHRLNPPPEHELLSQAIGVSSTGTVSLWEVIFQFESFSQDHTFLSTRFSLIQNFCIKFMQKTMRWDFMGCAMQIHKSIIIIAITDLKIHQGFFLLFPSTDYKHVQEIYSVKLYSPEITVSFLEKSCFT